jgi:hypothetical protein
MSNQGWRLVSGFVVLAIAGFGIYGWNLRKTKFSFDCSSLPNPVVINFSTNPFPAATTATLVCTTKALQWKSDSGIDFTIQFDNKDCFDEQSYKSTNGETAAIAGIRNPAAGVFYSGIGACKYSIWVGTVKHDPHVIIMK